MDIGSRIKEIRSKKNIMQIQLAEMIGTTQSAVAAIESGRRTPKIETLQRIAAALNVPLLSLLPPDLIEGSFHPSTEEEKQICELISHLNPEGQRKVKEYAFDLLKTGQYSNTKPKYIDITFNLYSKEKKS